MRMYVGRRLLCALAVGLVLSSCAKAKLNTKGQARGVASPSIMQVIPSSGPIGGGTVVTILGSGFDQGATVVFGGAACTPVVYVSANQLQCTTTAHAEGAVTVVITNPSNLYFEK